jgi:hypothetical protein
MLSETALLKEENKIQLRKDEKIGSAVCRSAA